jgi:hypothetical protein
MMALCGIFWMNRDKRLNILKYPVLRNGDGITPSTYASQLQAIFTRSEMSNPEIACAHS